MYSNKYKILFLLIPLFSFSLFAKNVSNGIINFGLVSGGKKIVRLNGDWEFYKGQTFSTLSSAQLKIDFLEVPGAWASNSKESNIPGRGCNTYRVLIKGLRPNTDYGIFSRTSPALSAKVFANGKLIFNYGNFSRHEKDYSPLQFPMLCSFTSNSDGVIELVIQVANFDQYSGGIISPIMFGLANDIEILYTSVCILLTAICGMLIFVLLTNFMIWFFDKSHTQGLFFSIFLLLLLFRITAGNFNLAGVIIKPINYSFQLKLKNLILLSFGFFSFVYKMDSFFTAKHPLFDKALSFTAFALALVLFCIPIKLVPYIVLLLILISMLFYAYSIYRMVLAIKVRNFYVGIYTCFYIVTFTGIILDIFFDGPSNDMLFNYTEISALILICIVVVYLALYLEFLVRSYLNKKNKFSERYVSYRKFVPSELPHILNKESFGKIELGDSTKFETTILLISQRIVTPENIQIGLREQFETISFYSTKIVEIIEDLGGTLFSITGDSIVALFNKSSKDAVSAADEIRYLLEFLNARRSQDYYPCLSFNIAVHYGSVLLGIIGGANRLGQTLISPNIELANSICTLGFYKNIPIIISEQVVNNLNKEELSTLRPLGRIRFREIPYPINLYGLTFLDDTAEVAKLEIPRTVTQRDADICVDI